MNDINKELKEIILESLLKSIGCMMIIDEKEYAKQLSNIYVEISNEK